MPFISKDWRSPGEEWVKTDEGWEKKKILECDMRLQNEILQRCSERIDEANEINSWIQQVVEDNKENLDTSNEQDNLQDTRDPLETNKSNNNTDSPNKLQPHCHITIKCTREIAGFNRLSDAFKRLDFRSAVHDVRRFNYIIKLLDILITYKLSTLSGCAQKVLFNILEDVAYQVSHSQQNIHTLHNLLRQLKVMIDCACWGKPLGSTQLWENHLVTINRILSIANRIQIREPGVDQYPKMEHLPEEVVREVLLRLTDHKDLENSSKAYSVMARVVDEQRIWRELTQFHFTPQQMTFVLNTMPSPVQDWQAVYHKLRKAFGLREEYAEMIQLCRNCRCLFWKSIGHPCIAEKDPAFQEKLEDVDKSSLHVPIPPQAFLRFFSL
uniref:F-box only protein 25 n=1 Tax=Cacopsylla melanoneura TaxID=428564 RepID=A0A8D8TZ18_9HEMI